MLSGYDFRDALAASPAHGADVAAYWKRLKPHLRSFEISRVGDITGLDRLGLPVVQVCRPQARSNAVTQGKGLTLEAAAVGAVLECIEMSAGEVLLENDHWYGALSEPALAVWRPLAPPGAAWPARDDIWRGGRDVATGRAVPVPHAIVCTDFSQGSAAGAAPILRTSVGLGAGAGLVAAVWHGLLEVIECDARLRFFARADGDDARQIRARAIVRVPLLDRLEAQDLRVGVWDMTARPGPRAVMVRIMENPAGNPPLQLPAEGFACRPDLAAAVEAALLEAVQARLAVISGAREDMTRALYDFRVSREALAADWAAMDPVRGNEPRADETCPATPAELARALDGSGHGPVIVVPLLSRPEIPLEVVRVLVPGLVTDPERLRDLGG